MKIDDCFTLTSLDQWAQGSSPWRCTTTTKSEKSELFPIGEGFGFFVFFGKQNESLASIEKRPRPYHKKARQTFELEWQSRGIFEECSWRSWTKIIFRDAFKLVNVAPVKIVQ